MGHSKDFIKYAHEENVTFPNKVKFKFGHYRDEAKNGADMLIDRVCVSPNMKKCDKPVNSVKE